MSNTNLNNQNNAPKKSVFATIFWAIVLAYIFITCLPILGYIALIVIGTLTNQQN